MPEVESRLQTMQLHSNMYVVQAGETVASIAFRYQLEPAELIALNPGLESNIKAGLRINVRPGTQLAPAVRSREQYAPVPTVRSPQQTEVVLTPVPGSPSISSDPITEEIVLNDPLDQEMGPQSGAGWSDQNVVVVEQTGDLREEIIEDTLDFEPVAQNDNTLQAGLDQMIGAWSWPTEGEVARDFAPNEVGGQGLDIAGVPGQDVRAAASGTVVYSGRDLSGGGNLIIVRHADNLMTTYSHTDNLYVAEDDIVQVGDAIASLGWNANKESVLRFEVRREGNALDPKNFLPLR